MEREQPPNHAEPKSSTPAHIDTHDSFSSQLQELTNLVSPKVSELLSEQALALDAYLYEDDSDCSVEIEGSERRINSKSSYDDDEDGMEDEWRRLDAASIDLRNELALASGLSSFMFDEDNDEEGNDDADGNDQSQRMLIQQQRTENGNSQVSSNPLTFSSSSHNNSSPNNTSSATTKQTYTLSDHANTLNVVRSTADRGHFSRQLLTKYELETILFCNTQPNNGVTQDPIQQNIILSCIYEYIEPLRPKTLKRLFAGFNPGPGERSRTDAPPHASGEDSRVTAYSAMPPADDDSSVDEKEDDVFIDVDGMSYPSQSRRRQPLPVRTVTIRIRLDVLCGAVMGCITDIVERMGGNMIKRQGGHLRGILPMRRVRVGGWEDGFVEEEDHHGVIRRKSAGHVDEESSLAAGISSLFSPSKQQKGLRFIDLPPYLVDCQLVTKKLGKTAQRILLIRIFRINDCLSQEEEEEEILDVPPPFDGPCQIDLEAECDRSVRGLREAAALVQRMKAGQGFSIDIPNPLAPDEDSRTVASHESTKSYLKSFGDAIVSPIRYFSNGTAMGSPLPKSNGHNQRSVSDLMSRELMRKCLYSPTVGMHSTSAFNTAKVKSHGVFPSLSKEDSPLVKASWVFLRECIQEFDRRCLSYSTLGVSPLFQFPALPTLDAHFIFQIKLMCRESMIVSLVKTASELEVFAREFEVACGNLDQLLRPTFELYQLAPPPLPRPLPLTAYPLDFQAPEDLTPPWGPEVAKALQTISNNTSTPEHNNADVDGKNFPAFDEADEAILLTVCAFHRQNDTEQGARLGRKNMQVMDRLAKMQAHKRNSIAAISHSYGSNLIATNAADEYHELCLKSSNLGSLSDMMHSTPQVPLLVCNVLVGNAAGTCYVTSSQILFVTQLVPILGGSKVHLFPLMDVDVTITPPSKNLLSPLPTGITLTTTIGKLTKTREEVYSFIPSIGARRFAKFIEVLRDVALEDPNNTLKFSERGGLIYMYDEKM